MARMGDMNEGLHNIIIPHEINDPKKPKRPKINLGKIEFESVHFKYEENSGIFSDFNLEINLGKKIGLVGHSGGGKTTLTKLILRLMDPQSGSIKIDDQDIKSITQENLRKNIAFVPQEPILFHRTLRENILYGDTIEI